MGLFHIVSEINSNFSQRSQIFPTPCILNAPAEGISRGIL